MSYELEEEINKVGLWNYSLFCKMKNGELGIRFIYFFILVLWVVRIVGMYIFFSCFYYFY